MADHIDAEAGAEPIAVIGMACRVPGAADVRQFWRNLVAGVASRTELSRDRLLAAGVPADQLDDPDFVPVAYLLDGVDELDAGLFGLSPREAALADPQHRLFLELCHSALEHAGWDPARYDGDIGVYGGRGMETYRWRHILANREMAGTYDHTTIGIGNHADTLTTLVSYRLNLRGPSLGVYTACSTSLVAVHLAAEALRAGECDMALAGGVSIELPGDRGYQYHEGGLESADGYCRPFDASATGTVWSSGGGVVLLKRLTDAIDDGDTVHAVIRGNAVNNDGAAKVGFTTLSVPGQVAAIANALAMSDVDPRTVTYLEAFGVGNPIGDPIEVEALTAVYGRGIDERQWCALGSVKSNVGHLSQGSGVVSLIKTVLALENGVIPANLNFTEPNPAIDFAASPFYVNATLAAWRPDGPRRAGVSSFGIGGTNAHVVLEEAPSSSPRVGEGPRLIQISARSAAALESAVERLAEHLSTTDTALGDAAYTLQAGRVAYPHRAAVIASDTAGAVAALRQPKRRLSHVVDVPPRVAFLFPAENGPVDQIYATEPAFAAAIDECGGPSPFAVGYALARLWQHWGVRPATMIGHSVGEYVAAAIAGVFELPDAVRLAALREGLAQPGAALTVSAPAERLDLPSGLSIVAINAPGTCVVAGPEEIIQGYAAQLADGHIPSRRLRGTYPLYRGDLGEFTAAVAKARPSAPLIPFLSTVTGTPISAEQATDPGYWTAQLREPVRFGASVAWALAEGPTVLLECGTGRQLANLAQAVLPPGMPRPVSSLGGQSPREDLYTAAARLWTYGVDLEPIARGRRVPLPGYPYQRSRHWIEPDPHQPAVPAPVEPQQEWLAVPTWRRRPPLLSAQPLGPLAVVGSNELAVLLRQAGADVVAVEPGDYYRAGIRGRRWIHAIGLSDVDGLAGDLRTLRAATSEPIDVVTANAYQVLGNERIVPGKAVPGFRHIDVDQVGPELVAELAGQEKVVALRAGHRWTPELERIPVPETATGVRPDGVYLVVGDGRGLIEGAGRIIVTEQTIHKYGHAIHRYGRLDGIVLVLDEPAELVALRAAYGDLDLDFVALCSASPAASAYFRAYAQSDHGWTAPVRSLAWLSPPDGEAARRLFDRAIAAALPHIAIQPGPADPPAEKDVLTQVAGIWSQLFGADHVRAEDDFFELGGNSLLAVQLVTQVRQALGVRLPMRSIFDTPTVAGMAARVAELQART